MSKAILLPESKKDIGGLKDTVSLSPSDKKEGAIGLITRFLRLSNNIEKVSNDEPVATYYGVYIPCEIKKGPDEEALHVYKNKSEALELVKRYKLARFKAFRNQPDAVSFALRGAEPIESTDGNENSIVGEKPYPFKAPSPQDMVALRKTIEAGLTNTVRDRVWDNPRYLISSGSTPTILQEGSRYNALHVAAKAMNAEICNLILTTVGNPSFVQKLYGNDADLESCEEFASILVDRYLNTPDKALNETPLHFAAKYGAEDAVNVLTSFPQCNIAAVNKFGEQPKDIICKRCSASNSELAGRIEHMLHRRYYVPVLHSEDGSGAPAIGVPFTPSHPPNLNRDPLSPRYEIRAFAGPMDEQHAEQFRRKWKTKPRPSGTLAPPTFRLQEMSKGLESVGRDLAQQMKVEWKEYWPFLDTFTDLRTPEGLTLLENFLKAKYDKAFSIAYNETIQLQTPDLSLSRISLGSIPQLSPVKDCTLSPMSELCVAMKTCTISSDRPHWRKTDPIRQRMCRKPTEKFITSNVVNGDTTPATNHIVSQLMCIERTCQVFAKRIADALHFSLNAEPEVASESLRSEAKHLQHTVFSYMDDERFKDINFTLIHSRLAQLVVYKLKQKTDDIDDISTLIEFLVKLRCPNDDIFSSDDERKTANCRSRIKLTHVIDRHVTCLSSFISEELAESDYVKGPSVTESECTQVWEKASKCICDWKFDVFERNSKRNASFRKNRSILSTSPQSESFVRRLTFDHDIGDGAQRVSTPQPHLPPQSPLSANSPAGDGDGGAAPALYTIDVAKCRVVSEEISEDESDCSEEEVFVTASENSTDESEMEDASDAAVAEPFIYGDEPSKMDRLVFEAVKNCRISTEQFPNVYRWRHAVALYSQEERNNWKNVSLDDSNSPSVTSWCASPVRPSRPVPPSHSTPTPVHSTPTREHTSRPGTPKSLSLQVSSWLRVTGPNSPRSALSAKNVGHNVSLGF